MCKHAALACQATHRNQQAHQGYTLFMRCIVLWRLSSAVISSLYNSIHPPEPEIIPPKAVYVWLPMWQGQWQETVTHTQSSHHMQCTIARTGWPTECSCGERYDDKIVSTRHLILMLLLLLLLKCCFTSTETVGLLGTGAQDVYLDFHTAPELRLILILLPFYLESFHIR